MDTKHRDDARTPSHPTGRPLRIGLISDTHGLLRPEALAALRGSAHVIHAGDIGSAEILAALRAVAPVTAVRGNNDAAPWAAALPLEEDVCLSGARLYVLHDLKEMAIDAAAAGYRAVVSGHSHRPMVAERNGVLYVNPGSAGPRRFKLPISVGWLEVAGDELRAGIEILRCH